MQDSGVTSFLFVGLRILRQAGIGRQPAYGHIGLSRALHFLNWSEPIQFASRPHTVPGVSKGIANNSYGPAKAPISRWKEIVVGGLLASYTLSKIKGQGIRTILQV